MTCEQFYNAAGTWLQVAGALLAAPDTVAHIFRSARAEIGSATATAWRALPRPWKRHPPANVLSGSARLPMATGAGSGLASGAAHGATVQTFSLADPVPTNLQKLHDMIQRANADVGQLRKLVSDQSDSLRNLDAKVDQSVARLETDTTAVLQRVNALAEDIKKQSIYINVRAIPLLAIGVLLTGFKGFWSDFWTRWLGAAPLTLALLILYIVVQETVLRCRTRRDASLDTGSEVH